MPESYLKACYGGKYMIEKPLKTFLSSQIPTCIWSVNNFTAPDNTATVYSEGGMQPSKYEDVMQYPQYQIYIRNRDYDKAKGIAQKVHDLLYEKSNFVVGVTETNHDGTTYEVEYTVYFIHALSPPIRIGINDDVMEYSVNIQCELRRSLKNKTNN